MGREGTEMPDNRNKEEILAILAQAWNARPHLRLCQLLYNAMRVDPRQLSLYDYENDDLADHLIAYCRLDVACQGSANSGEPVGG